MNVAWRLTTDYRSRDKINILQIMVVLLEILFFEVIETKHKGIRQSTFINFDK